MRPAARSLTAVAAVLLVALAASASARAATVTQRASAPLASGGTVTATLTYTPRAYYDANLTLTITRAGSTLLSRAITARPCGRTCAVQSSSAVHVVDVQGNGEPMVFVDLYTGGAHCCSVTNFYTYDPGTQTYRPYEYSWGDPGYTLKRLGNKYVFATADDRFAYAFTDYAASGLPVQYRAYDGTKLINVTKQYPTQIAANAALYLRAFRAQAAQHYSDSTGVIAAWAADEDELGRRVQVAHYLRIQAADRHLNSALAGEPENARFVTRLDAFLRRTGYLS